MGRLNGHNHGNGNGYNHDNNISGNGFPFLVVRQNSVAQLVVLVGLEWGPRRWAPCRNILNQLFPNSVSTGLGNPLGRGQKACPRQGG